MYSEPDGVASAPACGTEHVVQPSGPVRCDECPNAASGLHFRSFHPDSAATSPWARVVLLHGYGDHGGRYGHVLKSFASRGISCCSLDFRGHGHSFGRRAYVRRWEEFLDDLSAFLTWERSGFAKQYGSGSLAPLFVLGHSHGGLIAAAAAIAGRLNSVAGCILSSPYLQAKTPLSAAWSAFARVTTWLTPWLQVRSGLTPQMMSSDPEMCAEASCDPLLVHGATPRWYVGTLRVQAQTLRDAPKFGLPLLCLAGDADPVADSELTERFVDRAGSADKTLIRYPGKLHELLRETGREEIIETIFDWVRARSEQKM
jgi:alpha-beta hydrolase superfamily lysophospholipase